jgi:C4-dicarboxylate-specific signal transduction histidine kinase
MPRSRVACYLIFPPSDLEGDIMKDLDPTIIPWVFGFLAVGWFIAAAIMFWRWRRQDRRWREQTRRWQQESRVQQRIAELLQQEYEQLLTPEERQRREAQRQHLQQLRAQAEGELATEPARHRRT